RPRGPSSAASGSGREPRPTSPTPNGGGPGWARPARAAARPPPGRSPRRRQIADRACLAPKTVVNVLGRVYEKLGIHSRAELGALMASDVTTPPGDGARGPEADRTH